MMCKAQPQLEQIPPHALCCVGSPAGVVELLPRWLAPNLITLAGTFGLILAYFVSAYYVPSFSGDDHISLLMESFVMYIASTRACLSLTALPLHALQSKRPGGSTY